MFDFTNTHNDEHVSDDDETFELPVATDHIAVAGLEIPTKSGHPFKTPHSGGRPRGRLSKTEKTTNTPLLPTAGTSNLRLLPKVALT